MASTLIQAWMIVVTSNLSPCFDSHPPAVHSPLSSGRDLLETQIPGVLELSYILTGVHV